MPERIPDKPHFKMGEVCEIADTQPYVLRFWESEFPQLNPRKSRTGHPIYTRDDIDLILRIKRLLHEQEFTLADARERLDSEIAEGIPVAEAPESLATAADPEPSNGDRPASVAAPVDPGDVPSLESELDVTRRRLSELRDRYDTAVDEIRKLKGELAGSADLVAERDTARREADALRDRLARVEKDRPSKAHETERKQLARRVEELSGLLDDAGDERDRAVARSKRLEDERDRYVALLREAGELLRDLAGRTTAD